MEQAAGQQPRMASSDTKGGRVGEKLPRSGTGWLAQASKGGRVGEEPPRSGTGVWGRASEVGGWEKSCRAAALGGWPGRVRVGGWGKSCRAAVPGCWAGVSWCAVAGAGAGGRGAPRGEGQQPSYPAVGMDSRRCTRAFMRES
ncbi:hypothetical protein GCM10018785_71220 [Streptomyces longispororuber]|uniref:Uncharacterized protein n=1 Tax=Streptomyces longispororuber TaxID=68230 RepID=A0A919DZ57_9ACTN|nr:hypothetical protein GCM10018785_71220 [Streptomyces longispororuber]